MSPLVDYVLFNKNIPELPDSSREELEAVYREVQPIISKEVVERLTPFYRQLVDGIVSKGLGERYIVPDDDDVGQETTPESEVILRHTEASQRTPPDTEVSDTVNEPVNFPKSHGRPPRHRCRGQRCSPTKTIGYDLIPTMSITRNRCNWADVGW
jgi:hypothetical protein